MNLLAHAFLADPGPQALVGSLLADFLRRNEREGLSEGIMHGMAQHQRIDAFTDSHPVVRRSRTRISAPYRRYSGILIDVFYDHFLAAEWSAHASMTLDDFVQTSHTAILEEAFTLPPDARDMAEAICSHNLLLACRTEKGVERTLERVASRLRVRSGRVIEMAGGVADMQEQREALLHDFREFFPELQAHVKSLRQQ